MKGGYVFLFDKLWQCGEYEVTITNSTRQIKKIGKGWDGHL